jgi:hypothetical protein
MSQQVSIDNAGLAIVIHSKKNSILNFIIENGIFKNAD